MMYLSKRNKKGILIMRHTRRTLSIVRKETWMKVKDPAALRRKRLNRKYSQRDLAFLVKRSQNAIHLIETGGMKTLSEDLALLIAARLDVDWEDYFTLEEHEVMPKVISNSHTIEHHESKVAS
ncbi:helix-turn-helix transcriptional regulator [Arthrobacter sp. TMP15]|uniref:helix-turn-helix transcriptional regulator n=1 Tax=Arthrobacter sp. TMP15 TaxID=3140789 RepID=UPI0031BB0960